MAEGPIEGAATARAARNPSSGEAGLARRVLASGPLGMAVLALTLASTVLLLLAEIYPLYEIEVAEAACEEQVARPEQADQCVQRGVEAHLGGLVLVAGLGLVMGAGAALGRSRPASFAICALALLVLLIALGSDLPNSRSTGEIGRNFLDARAVSGPGLWFELVGGATLAAAGALAVYRTVFAERGS